MGRVLIVDDDDDSREALGLVVESWGHEVKHASSGPLGLALLLSFKPDIVILDLGLPGMDGVQLVKVIREVDGYRSFVIALTGWTRAYEREAALRAGCSIYFVKPADLGELEYTLERVMAVGADRGQHRGASRSQAGRSSRVAARLH